MTSIFEVSVSLGRDLRVLTECAVCTKLPQNLCS